MAVKILIYRGLIVLLFYIVSQYNIAYQSKHNMRYNKKKNYFKQPCSNQLVVTSPNVYTVRKK